MELLNKIKKYISDGWVIECKHPTLNISLYNYNAHTEYENHWDDITTICRGLCLDSYGNIVSKTFPKFFNYQQKPIELIPNEFSVHEKLDGSFIQMFIYQGQLIISTKGGFDNEQVEMTKEVLIQKFGEHYETYLMNYMSETETYVFELIHPQNRIVVDYGDIKTLVLLAIFYNGVESYEYYHPFYESFPMPREYGNPTLEDLLNHKEDNFEGFVLVNHKGERTKIKLDEYKRLHRIVTNTTSYDIWEHMRFGKDFNEILERVPDEFLDFVHTKRNEIQTAFDTKLKEINDEFYSLIDCKELAQKLSKNPNKHFLFSRLHSYSDKFIDEIWKSIKPEYEKPKK